MSSFIAIDVETANAGRHSICEIAFVGFRDGVPVWRWQTLIDPEEPFDAQNIRIHGIAGEHVTAAPTFASALDQVRAAVEDQVLACHSPFDYEAIHAAADRYDVAPPCCTWIDTCEVARTAWPELDNHKLATICRRLGIELDHHDAGSDALACGRILEQASRTMVVELPALIERIGTLDHTVDYRPAAPSAARYSPRIEATGRKDGPLAGHVVVCTGEMAAGEIRIADLAAELGCDVEDRFTQSRTTILITGFRDPDQYERPKSAKLCAAEKAIAKGKEVTIMTEDEFLALAGQHGLSPP